MFLSNLLQVPVLIVHWSLSVYPLHVFHPLVAFYRFRDSIDSKIVVLLIFEFLHFDARFQCVVLTPLQQLKKV